MKNKLFSSEMFYFNKYETRTFELAKLIKREEDVNVLYNVYVYLNARKMLMYCIMYMFT